jgi:hypothetical protein
VGPISELRKAKWKALKGCRDGLFHQGRALTIRQTRDLIKEVAQLEGDVNAIRLPPKGRE